MTQERRFRKQSKTFARLSEAARQTGNEKAAKEYDKLADEYGTAAGSLKVARLADEMERSMARQEPDICLCGNPLPCGCIWQALSTQAMYAGVRP